MKPAPDIADREALEIDLLSQALHRYWGYDFRNYASASFRRRILQAAENEGAATVSGLQERVLHDPAAMQRLLRTLSINVTSMFRDPSFYGTLRDAVVPQLHTYPFVRVWVAGCSSGEEAYSLAIVLSEADLLDRCRIYATDISREILTRATSGIYPLSKMKEYTRNYQRAGGERDFCTYYTADDENAILSPALKKNLTFAQHNLAQDASFNEFNLILCRNVMIYFNKELQARVFTLMHESLCRLGVLGLGSRESLKFTPFETHYEELHGTERLYRKVR